MSPPQIYICRGSSCRKADLGKAELQKKLSSDVQLQAVKCQKICKAPVLGVEHDGELHWFKRMDSKKALAGLDELLQRGKMKKSLRKRLSNKRMGRMR